MYYGLRVKVKIFSLYRDIVGLPEVEIDVEKCSAKEVLLKLTGIYPKLRETFRNVSPIVFINGEPADLETDKGLEICTEVAIAPPASGGSSNIKVGFFSSDIEVSLDSIIMDNIRKEVGAIAIFIGVVKGEINGKEVVELIYEAYEPYATKILERIAQEELKRHDLYSVQILHRLGNAKPGQKTLVIAVSARSRKEAIEALSTILERVKSEVPVYKLEKRVDGEYWVVGDGNRYKRSTNV